MSQATNAIGFSQVTLVLDRFDAAWQGDVPPALSQFLSEVNSSVAHRRELLIELIPIDLEHRWRKYGSRHGKGNVNKSADGTAGLPGTPTLVDYCKCFPDLAPLEDLPPALFAQEYRVRRQWGDWQGPVDFEAAYPTLFAAVGTLLVQADRDLSRECEASAPGVSVVPEGVAIDTSSPILETIGSDDCLPAEQSRRLHAIGRYRVERILGQGGFGVVYLAHDDELQRRVAIKVPRANRIRNSSDADEYLVEAQVLARLDHPHIVPVFDVGRSADGLPFVVSKYIPGSNLAERIKSARLTTFEAVILVARMAEALQYAHEHRLVHRDVKPANILLDEDNRPFLVDFGLALKEADFGKESGVSGTPAYMSPEQASGDGHLVDGRSDIYSLGVVLYELLSGQRPYDTPDVRQMLTLIMTAEPRPPRQLAPTIPKELERITLKALAKRPSERYTTALDFADDLQRFAQQNSDGASAAVSPLSSSALSVESAVVGANSKPASRRSIIATMVILTAIVICATTGYFASFGWPFQSPIAQPIQIESLSVNHFATLDGNNVQPRGEFGKQSFGAALGDEFTVQVKLSRPAYSYLIVYRPDGKYEVLYPQDDTDVPELTATPHYPAKRRDERYVMEEGAGLWVVALLVSETPLPRFREWQTSHPDCPWSSSAGNPEKVWWDDGQLIHALARDGGPIRASKTSSSLQPFARLTDWLRLQGRASVQAIGYSVK